MPLNQSSGDGGGVLKISSGMQWEVYVSFLRVMATLRLCARPPGVVHRASRRFRRNQIVL